MHAYAHSNVCEHAHSRSSGARIRLRMPADSLFFRYVSTKVLMRATVLAICLTHLPYWLTHGVLATYSACSIAFVYYLAMMYVHASMFAHAHTKFSSVCEHMC
jgi:hypothetical protein